MASIKITELRPAGSELFQDAESFLNELNEEETLTVLGAKGRIILTQKTKSVGYTKTNLKFLNNLTKQLSIRLTRI